MIKLKQFGGKVGQIATVYLHEETSNLFHLNILQGKNYSHYLLQGRKESSESLSNLIKVSWLLRSLLINASKSVERL